MYLEETFIALCKRHSANNAHVRMCWDEIAAAYTEEKRYYHNLAHLENVLAQLIEVKSQIRDWDAIRFALFYHDVVYNTLHHDNEEKSAELAEKRLQMLGVSPGVVQLTVQHILATKSHPVSADADTNLFTDADLSILGAPAEIYRRYAKEVREEYWVYPDLVYKPGRKKVLQHFLSMPHIFKTTIFRERFEQQAKINLGQELNAL